MDHDHDGSSTWRCWSCSASTNSTLPCASTSPATRASPRSAATRLRPACRTAAAVERIGQALWRRNGWRRRHVLRHGPGVVAALMVAVVEAGRCAQRRPARWGRPLRGGRRPRTAVYVAFMDRRVRADRACPSARRRWTSRWGTGGRVPCTGWSKPGARTSPPGRRLTTRSRWNRVPIQPSAGPDLGGQVPRTIRSPRRRPSCRGWRGRMVARRAPAGATFIADPRSPARTRSGLELLVAGPIHRGLSRHQSVMRLAAIRVALGEHAPDGGREVAGQRPARPGMVRCQPGRGRAASGRRADARPLSRR